MRYSYTLGFSEFKLAQQTYIRSTPRRRFWFHFQIWGLFVIGIAALCAFALTTSTTVRGLLIGVMGGAFGGGVVAALIGLVFRPWNLRRCYEAFNGPVKVPIRAYLEFAEDTFVSGIEGKSEGRFQRTSFCEVVENEKMLLLFVAKKRFIYVPKFAIPAEALAELHAWLSLPGPTSC